MVYLHTMPHLLDIARSAHNANPWAARAAPFVVDGVQVGFVRDAVLAATREFASPALVVTDDGGQLTLAPAAATRESRTAALAAFVEWLRDTRRFPDPLDGWRGERYVVYGRARTPALELERAACGLFGVATFGVHVTAYTRDGRIWVPQRARTKQTWPGYLDNSVAGGITAGETPLSSVVRECAEEASLDAALVRENVRAAGTISYFFRTHAGWWQPEMQYVFDLELPADVQLRPCDGEAESFTLADVPTVMAWLRDGRFKPNCALGTSAHTHTQLTDSASRLLYASWHNSTRAFRVQSTRRSTAHRAGPACAIAYIACQTFFWERVIHISCLDVQLGAAPVAAAGVVVDLVVRLETEPVGDRAVLARSLGERNLRAERLLRRLVSTRTHAPSQVSGRVGKEGAASAACTAEKHSKSRVKI